jgi:hypothetical protein
VSEARTRLKAQKNYREDRMRVMVIVKATNDSEDGKMPTPDLLEQMGAFNQQLKDAGSWSTQPA